MREKRLDDTTLLRFPKLADAPGLVHAVTSVPWNLAPHRGPQRELAVERRRKLCAHLGLDFDKLTAPSQVHGGDVVPISDDVVGAGRFGRDGAVAFVDGLVTDRRDVAILNLAADCVLILAYDPVRRAVGSAHASWRGLMAGVATNLVQQLSRCYGTKPADLLAGVGPSAGPEAYAVRDDVIRILRTRVASADDYLKRVGDQTCLNLWRLAEDQLVAAGVRREAIETANLCTMSDTRFFSHRRQGEAAGRIGLICALT